jgi:hypothetical protein
MNWLKKISNFLEKPVEKNPIDKTIIEKLPQEGEVTKVYEARWVWYHTLLAVELFITNILLMLILFVLAIK